MMAPVQAPLSERLHDVMADIDDAVRSSGREPSDVTTIVVTKFHPASMVRELAALGVRDFGESRHQEARAKVSEVNDPALTWHFVGQVQGKKARQIASYAKVIHSVDKESLLIALASAGNETDCFLQLNLTDDPDRGGVGIEGIAPLAEAALGVGGIRLMGVMAVAPLEEDPRRSFVRVREASESLQKIAPEARWISAGMSGDYRAAIVEGATHLRIGTAITGNRPVGG